MTASDDYHILGDFVMNILIVAVLRRTTAGRSSEGLVHSNIYSDIGRPAICVFDYCSRTFCSKKQRILVTQPTEPPAVLQCYYAMQCSGFPFSSLFVFFDSFLREREGVTITTTTYHLLNVYSVIEFNPRYYHIPYRN